MHEHSGFKTHNQKMAQIQWYHLTQGSTKRNIGPRGLGHTRSSKKNQNGKKK